MTEKIHGANFCFLTDGRIVRVASRRRVLSRDDGFFGCFQTQLVASHRERVLQLFAAVKARHPEAAAVWLFGELFGGGPWLPWESPTRFCGAR